MSMFQTDHAAGKVTTPIPYQHGVEAVAIFEYVFNEAYANATDIIELGTLPGTAKITGATMIGTGLGANTADVGIMEGPVGEPTDADGNQRAMTADLLFDGVSVNDAENAADLSTCLAITPTADHRAIGAVISADVAAGAAKKLQVLIRYTY